MKQTIVDEKWVKPRLPIEVMQGISIGEMAIAAVGGTEPSDDFFNLLSQITLAGISAKDFTLQGKTVDMAPSEICFAKPYYPKTMKVVEHLTSLGYLELVRSTDRGQAYSLVYPHERSERVTWMKRVLDATQDFMIQEHITEVIKAIPQEQRWAKKHVERMPDAYAEKFPEDVPSCYLCNKEKSGIYVGVQRIPNNDPRLPSWAEGANVLFTFGLCSSCYELADVERRVLWQVLQEKNIV